MIMDIPRVGPGQIPSLQKLPMAEMPLEAYKGGGYYRLLYFVNTTSSQTRGPELTFTERTMPI